MGLTCQDCGERIKDYEALERAFDESGAPYRNVADFISTVIGLEKRKRKGTKGTIETLLLISLKFDFYTLSGKSISDALCQSVLSQIFTHALLT